ncbi:3',5'-cyclic nucleotide phosphodiesterase, putative [Plasmodium ovale wallikeri]|uniref:Phosphodiesterase n=1 Tax=Plasmodium ovale wallikeri TaxID=864142 RepID=A0A1A8YHL2_PLAOA|nr:3',5'-cyclic nucleotide phosphodiesterase, putative [Plasmodium ovale wallikeri]SBT44419.1 3',5'-cyclic nucleotide phosphodiesterase, putative [Plasmodium ovale wallikeri]
MDRKIDKEDNHGGEENEVRKRHKLFKELSKSFQQSERKYDDGELTKSFTFHDEFVKSGKYKSDNAKEYLWKKMKDGAKKKSQKEYDRCVRKDKLKFVCTARKYMKYFFDLRGKNYRSDSTSSYSSIGNSTCTVENCNSNCASVGGSIGMNQSSSISSLSMVNKKGDIDNANVVHGFGSMGSNGTSLNFVDYVKEKEEPFYEIYYEQKMKRKQNNHLTKYFSIDNSIPTSPIEDILSNLKFLLDHINKLEEDANDKCKILLTKMKEKIKKCENILRTQNLNEVQICKYRKFERVYNMWCLDKNENSFEKDEESKTFSSHNVHKKSFNSFSHIHSLLSSKLQDHFNESYEWNANIEIVYKRNVFISIGYKLLYPLGVLELNFDKERLKKFLFKMYSLYNDVPYHNSLHAAQVAHFSKSMLFMLDMNRKISGIDEFCLHVSSLCHDVGHPGLNNYFLVNSENNLALTYNDNSVLENYHCSLVFKSLKDQNCNIFENYPSHIFTTCKKNIIRAILSTDMKNHFEYISNFRTSKEFIDYENMTNDQIWQTFCLILKAADIGHATLDWDKHFEWTIKINEEFYLQGLLEKSLNMTKSSLCDITTIDKLAASQIGFLKHLCIPLYNELNFISKNKVIYNNCICSIENNIEQWEKNENNQQTLGLEEKYKNENLVDRIKLLKVV